MALSRIQRLALILSAINSSILYRSGKQKVNADSFSWLPLPTILANVPEQGNTVLLFKCLNIDPLSAAQIKTYTDYDLVLCKVRNYVL